MEWVKENISAFKYPRIIEVVEELPKSVVGKILRRELREELKQIQSKNSFKE